MPLTANDITQALPHLSRGDLLKIQGAINMLLPQVGPEIDQALSATYAAVSHVLMAAGHQVKPFSVLCGGRNRKVFGDAATALATYIEQFLPGLKRPRRIIATRFIVRAVLDSMVARRFQKIDDARLVQELRSVADHVDQMFPSWARAGLLPKLIEGQR